MFWKTAAQARKMLTKKKDVRPCAEREEHMEHYIDDLVIREFIDRLHELEKSSATISKYSRDVNAFRNWLGDGGLVIKSKVIEYKQALREKYRIPSANSMLSALNTFFPPVHRKRDSIDITVLSRFTVLCHFLILFQYLCR